MLCVTRTRGLTQFQCAVCRIQITVRQLKHGAKHKLQFNPLIKFDLWWHAPHPGLECCKTGHTESFCLIHPSLSICKYKVSTQKILPVDLFHRNFVSPETFLSIVYSYIYRLYDHVCPTRKSLGMISLYCIPLS